MCIYPTGKEILKRTEGMLATYKKDRIFEPDLEYLKSCADMDVTVTIHKDSPFIADMARLATLNTKSANIIANTSKDIARSNKHVDSRGMSVSRTERVPHLLGQPHGLLVLGMCPPTCQSQPPLIVLS